MNALRAPALALTLLLTAMPALAQEKKDPAAEVERLAREAAKQIVGALEVILRAIPQYELPEIQPNGDIIIRRRNPPPSETPEKEPGQPPAKDGEQTDT